MVPEVYELEEALPSYAGAKYCINCANGTNALRLALMALDIGPRDEVVTSAFSFFASAEVIGAIVKCCGLNIKEAHPFKLLSESLHL